MGLSATDNYIQTIRNSVSFELIGFRNHPAGFKFIPQHDLQYFIKNQNPQQVELRAKKIIEKSPLKLVVEATSSKRYQFTKPTCRERLLQIYFERAFELAPDKVISAAENTEVSSQSYYPLWKRATHIELPKAMSEYTGNFINKFLVGGIVTCVVFIQLLTVYSTIAPITSRIVPIVINNVPFAMIKAVNTFYKAIDFIEPIRDQFLTCAFYGTLLHIGSHLIFHRDIPIISRILTNKIYRIAILILNPPQSALEFILKYSFKPASFAWNSFNEISSYFKSIAVTHDTERLQICKKKAYNAWKTIIQQHAAPQAAVA